MAGRPALRPPGTGRPPPLRRPTRRCPRAPAPAGTRAARAPVRMMRISRRGRGPAERHAGPRLPARVSGQRHHSREKQRVNPKWAGPGCGFLLCGTRGSRGRGGGRRVGSDSAAEGRKVRQTQQAPGRPRPGACCSSGRRSHAFRNQYSSLLCRGLLKGAAENPQNSVRIKPPRRPLPGAPFHGARKAGKSRVARRCASDERGAGARRPHPADCGGKRTASRPPRPGRRSPGRRSARRRRSWRSGRGSHC
jgi:hypothetical protein